MVASKTNVTLPSESLSSIEGAKLVIILCAEGPKCGNRVSGGLLSKGLSEEQDPEAEIRRSGQQLGEQWTHRGSSGLTGSSMCKGPEIEEGLVWWGPTEEAVALDSNQRGQWHEARLMVGLEFVSVDGK